LKIKITIKTYNVNPLGHIPELEKLKP